MVVVHVKKKILKSLFKKLNTEPQFNEQSNQQDIELKKQKISSNYDQSLETFKALYSVPKNIDVKVRETYNRWTQSPGFCYLFKYDDESGVYSKGDH